MRGIHGTVVVLGFVAALSGTACGGEERRPARAPVSRTWTTSAALTGEGSSVTPAPITDATARNSATRKAPPTPIASAVMRVTSARCDRQAACNNVGTNRAFADRDSCANEIGHDVVAVLTSEQCPSGVDADLLAACVSDLQSEPCGEKARARAAEGPSSCGLESLCVGSAATRDAEATR